MTLERFPSGSRGQRWTAFLPRVSDKAEAGVALRLFRRRGEEKREPALILVDIERTLIQPVAGRSRRAQLLLIEQRRDARRGGHRSEQRSPLQQGSSIHVFRSRFLAS